MSLFSALQEFTYAANILSPLLVPSVTREERRKALNVVINELSDDTFKRGVIINRMLKMNMIDMSEGISKQYNNAEAQVEGIISWMPRMKQHRDKLKKAVVKHRKEYKLNI